MLLPMMVSSLRLIAIFAYYSVALKLHHSQKIMLAHFVNPYLIAEFSIIIAAIINSDTSQH